MTVLMREKIDMDHLDFLMNNPDVPKVVKRELEKLSATIVEGCWAKITYTLGKQAKDSSEALGRLNADGNVGLQGLKRDVRNFLAQRNYWDIDMVAAHPTLCLALCRQQNLTHVYQTEYLVKREEKLSELMDALRCSRNEAKAYITALYFGEDGVSAALPVWFKALHQEVSNARKVITQDEAWTDALKFLNGKKKNRIGSAFSFILQSIERDCLLSLEKSAKRNGRRLDTYIHDGGLISRQEGEEEFPSALLRAFEKDIETDTGFAVSLVSKPMESTYVYAKKSDEAYQQRKRWFETEECVFSVKNPCCWVRVYGKEIQMLGNDDLMKNYENITIENEAFIRLWRRDPARREYEKLIFLPGLPAPPKMFNLFTGWAVEPKQNDALVERWVYLISNITNHDAKVRDWVLDWLAHLFQKPYEKPGVALIVKGKKGSGKDTPFEPLSKLMGDMYYNTGTPEKSIFSNFNGMMMRNLFFKFEEATYKDNKAQEDALKYIVTCENMDIQQKGKDSFNVQNFSRFAFTTNHEVPVVTSDDERRFCFVQTSDKHRGDRAFWNETYEGFKHPEFSSALLYYLMNRDLTNFKPRDFPETEYGKSVKQAFIPIHAQYFRNYIERTIAMEDDEVETIAIPEFREQAIKVLTKINEFSPKFKMNHRQLHDAIEDDYKDVITKTKPGNKVHLSFKLDAMRQHLIDKGWWVEI